MDNFINFYQNIPFHINPIAFKIGFFQIGWYALSYLAAFAVIYWLLRYRIKKQENGFQILEQSKNHKEKQNIKYQMLDTFFLYAIFGVLIGGRLGYILFYNMPYYIAHPLEIVSPYNFKEHLWVGIYGMSYHGGLLAVILIAICFCRPVRSSVKAEVAKGKFNGVNFWDFSDFVVPAIPAGYFFGRLGNFFNGELYGRVTQSSWGMYFFDGENTFLRFPSQLIEAFLEGAVIFFALWIFRNKPFLKGRILFMYIFLYGLARFLAEFFRQPDEQIGYISGFLTLGQIFSLLMIFIGIFSFFSKKWYNNTRSA
jgi:phosphatidylglycerol---prolipoprotein diacylglyceryl transferase